MNNHKTFILVWLYGGKATPIIQGVVEICQHKRSLIKNQPQYKKGKLLLRTIEGFKKYPNWEPKNK